MGSGLAKASSLVVHKQSSQVQWIAQQVEKAQTTFTTVQMNLNEHVLDLINKTSELVRGIVIMKNPNLLYVHYQAPINQFFYMTRRYTQLYQPDQNMDFKQKIGSSVSMGYFRVGQRLDEYFKDSYVSLWKETASTAILLLKAKTNKYHFQSMKIFISKKNWWPYRVDVRTNSVLIRIVFNQFKFNIPVRNGFFHFVPPRGVSVVKEGIDF